MALYLGSNKVKLNFSGSPYRLIIYSTPPAEFHVVEDGKLIILGALSANAMTDGLYLDCVPEADWIYPVQSGNVLTVAQVYLATQSGNILEVE